MPHVLRKIITVTLPFTKLLEDLTWLISNNNQYAHLMYGNSTVRFTVSLDTAKPNLARKTQTRSQEVIKTECTTFIVMKKREKQKTDTYTVQMPRVPNTARITGSSAHVHMMDQSDCLLT